MIISLKRYLSFGGALVISQLITCFCASAEIILNIKNDKEWENDYFI
jgi:hypothetical protein